MPHGAVIALELAGAVLILAGFTLAQLRLLDQHSLVYLVLNLLGSFVLAVIALVAAGSWDTARSKGLLRTESKSYVIQEGDVLNIRFNV